MNKVKKDHEELKRKLERLLEDRIIIEEFMKAPAVSRILRKYEQDIEEIKEELCDSEKKNFDRLQADIRARRALIADFKAAYKNDLESARSEIAAFERDNALLLAGEKVEDAEAEELLA